MMAYDLNPPNIIVDYISDDYPFVAAIVIN